MKLFTFLIIAIISKISLSTKCEHPELQCLELCCEITKFYDMDYEYCEDIPEEAMDLWLARMHYNNRTWEVVEYGTCETADGPYAIIPSCHTPYYYTKSKELVLQTVPHVPCTRLEHEFSYGYILPGIIGLVVLPLCLPIMVVYTCWKVLKEKKLTFKLVSCYLVTTAMYLLVSVVIRWYRITSAELLVAFIKYGKILGLFLFNSTCLWLNVIGYRIWSDYKQGIAEHNSSTDKRRFICYSIYVWGIAAIISSIQLMFLGPSWNFDISGISQFGIAVYNMVTFLVMTVNICLTSCRVINLTHDVRFKSKLLYMICSLCLMMGIPRMLLMITAKFAKTNRILIYDAFALEPFVIFIVLVLKTRNVFKCHFICCWCRKNEQMSPPLEIVHTNTNVTNLPSLTEGIGISET